MGILSEFEWKGPLYGSISLLLNVYVFFAFRRFFALRSRSRSAYRISFSAGSYLVAAFTITAIASQQAASTTTYIEVVKWSQIASIVGQVSLILLVARLTRTLPLFAVVALSAAYAIATLMHVISVSGMFVSYLGEIHLLSLPITRSLLATRVPYAAWKMPVDVTNILALVALFGACWRLYRRGDRTLASLTTALVLVVAMENLRDMYFAGAIYLAPFGLVLMLVVFLACPEDLHRSAASPDEHFGRRALSRGKFQRRPLTLPDFRVPRYSPWEHNPLIGLVMAMFLVSAAQALAWNGFETIIILLALLGMGHATISVLNRAGSGVGVRILALVALAIIALP